MELESVGGVTLNESNGTMRRTVMTLREMTVSFDRY